MNKYIVSLSAIVLIVMAVSCEKALEEKPKTVLDPENFFENPAGYESVVMGIYVNVPLFVPQTHEMIIDLYAAPSSAAEQALPVYNNGPTPFFYNARDAWNKPYSMVKNANFILAQLPDSPLDEQKRNQLTAEARFLRAYAFFDLVQLFGDIPLPLKVADDYDGLRLTRTPQADVYRQILEDLTFAEENLPETSSQNGRVYKMVATALLARVYLTMAGSPLHITAHYSDALQKAVTVINSGKFKLIDDYAAVFHQVNYTSESIWEKQYVPGRGGNPLHGLSCTAPGYNAILVPDASFINSFPKGDRRKEWGIRQAYKGPNGVSLERPFFHKFVDTAMIDNATLPSGAIVSYSKPIIRLAELYLIAAEAENELNGPQQAYQYINTIRRRARINKSDPQQVPDLAGLSKEQFRAAVTNEWNWELHQEGMGWQLMKRTDTFSKIQARRGSTLSVPIGPYNQTWPIPNEEITNNNIPQNPLYQ